LFGQNNPVAVLIVIGAGYGLGAILFDRITPPPPGDATFSFRGIFVDHWSFSRSLLSGLLLYWAASQGYFMIAARLLPDADLGGARTAQNLAGMITTVLLMFENQATPAAAALAHYGNVGDVRLWVHSLFKKWTLPFIGFVALAAIGAFAVHHILYRNRYADFSYLTFVFALHQLLLGLNRPYAVGLKAIERTTPIFWGHCAGAIVMVVASWTLISSLGALGVAIGFVLSALALLLILHLSFWRLAK
jgi:O-antigen/teichoic acid export membrane protein